MKEGLRTTSKETTRSKNYQKVVMKPKYKKLRTLLVVGGYSQIPIFRELLIERMKEYRIIWMDDKSSVRGASMLNRSLTTNSEGKLHNFLKNHIILFD